MLNEKEKKTILKRFRYVQGQLQGIEKMIERDRSVKEIFTQLKAVEQGIYKAVHVVFEDQLKKHFAEVLSERLATCPGNCSDAERLQFVRREFAKLDLKGIIESLSWLEPREERLNLSATKKRRGTNET